MSANDRQRNLGVTTTNPDTCTNGHRCAAHEAAHQHGPSCGHDAVKHGDHTDYVVAGHLHHQHKGHCDNHGEVRG